MSSGKVMAIRVIIGLIKSISFHQISYYSDQDNHDKSKTNVYLSFCNYTAKPEVKKQEVLIAMLLRQMSIS